jgi:hypothetical protein
VVVGIEIWTPLKMADCAWRAGLIAPARREKATHDVRDRMRRWWSNMIARKARKWNRLNIDGSRKVVNTIELQRK